MLSVEQVIVRVLVGFTMPRFVLVKGKVYSLLTNVYFLITGSFCIWDKTTNRLRELLWCNKMRISIELVRLQCTTWCTWTTVISTDIPTPPSSYTDYCSMSGGKGEDSAPLWEFVGDSQQVHHCWCWQEMSEK